MLGVQVNNNGLNGGNRLLNRCDLCNLPFGDRTLSAHQRNNQVTALLLELNERQSVILKTMAMAKHRSPIFDWGILASASANPFTDFAKILMICRSCARGGWHQRAMTTAYPLIRRSLIALVLVEQPVNQALRGR